MDFVVNFFTNNFENCVWLAVLLVAMCPMLESKIAIPLAMNTAFWGNSAFTPAAALLLSFVGSVLPSFLIMIVFRRIKKKTAGFITFKFLQKYQAKSFEIEKESSKFKKYLLLCCFVSVPIPLTGVWTGSVIAGLTNLKLKYCFISIVLGAFVSSCAITLLCSLFTNSISYIFIISILIIIIFLFGELIFTMIKQYIKKKKEIN